ncbi:MAG: HDOD domain-containing protein [Candidatus Hydrogenedentes bacterium]|nr:HDOD domain-containing protein [Candidatus Hydrogenedentota bacterium]
MKQEHLQRLERVVSRAGDLPAIPEVVADVLRLTSDPTTAMAEIGETVQRDPALTAKILRVSNSPYYGMKQYVGTLKLALVILGVREVRNIVLGISVFSTLQNDRMEHLWVQSLWNHSVTVAALARKLGSHLKLPMHGEDFIGGLLHDIGKMLLWRQLGKSYTEVYRQSGGASEKLCAAEEAKFGFNHADAAAALARYWNLPETLADALWYHHTTEEALLAKAKDPRLAAIVRIANLAAHDRFSEDISGGHQSCVDEPTWRLLDKTTNPIESDDRFLVLSGFKAELSATPAPAF